MHNSYLSNHQQWKRTKAGDQGENRLGTPFSLMLIRNAPSRPNSYFRHLSSFTVGSVQDISFPGLFYCLTPRRHPELGYSGLNVSYGRPHF